MPIRNLRPLALLVIAMVVIDALWTPVVLSSARLFPVAYMLHVVPIAKAVDLAALAFKILTMVVFGIWIYLAGKNLIDAGITDLEFTPASRIWWFAVPIATLFKPFQGMRELWNASRNVWPYTDNNLLLGTWWALWLAHNFVGYFGGIIAGQGQPSVDLFVIESLFDVATAIAAILLVHGITAGQASLDQAPLAEVFA
jgi:hypothetical protein